MANEEHVKRLKEGVAKWNVWREDREETVAPEQDFDSADLTGARLDGADLDGANLTGANLTDANLTDANLVGADLIGADLTDAELTGARLTRARLDGANLIGAYLIGPNLTGANLEDANLTGAMLADTVFGRVDLTSVIGLETCEHWAPSIIDHQTLQKSGRLPLAFLRGVGLPDTLIEYLPSLFNQAIQYYSCFISYSSKDQDFAAHPRRLAKQRGALLVRAA